MKLLRLDEVDFRTLSVRFKKSPVGQFIPMVLFLAFMIIIGWLYFAGKIDLPFWGLIFIESFFSLFLWLSCRSFSRTLAASNWILDVGGDGVYVKFRSYHNNKLPKYIPQVIGLDVPEIESVHITKQKLTMPDMRGKRVTRYCTYLDLNMAEGDLAFFKKQLKHERSLRNKTGFTVKHYPVSVVGNGVIRIEWGCWYDNVTPPIKRAVEELSKQGVVVEPCRKEEVDLTSNSKGDNKLDDKILYLAEHGNIIAAVKMTRRAYGMNLSEAKDFVDGLQE